MSNWTVTINKEEYEFDMFSEAVKMMKTAIKQHICINTDVFNTEANIFRLMVQWGDSFISF